MLTKSSICTMINMTAVSTFVGFSCECDVALHYCLSALRSVFLYTDTSTRGTQGIYFKNIIYLSYTQFYSVET